MMFAVVLLMLVLIEGWSFVHMPFEISLGTPDILHQAKDAFDVVREASMPKSGEGAIACGISEAISGSVGALLSRRTASALKDKKRDGDTTKVASTATFFGIRGLIRGSARILGIPRPLVLIGASLIASAASESAKLRDRRSKGLDDDSETYEEELSGAEIAGDISKWICFDTILESLPTEIAETQNLLERYPLYFGVGSFSGSVGAAIRESIDHYPSQTEGGQELSGKKAWVKAWEKVPKASLENGVLFLFYAITINVLDLFLPEVLREELIFARIIDKIEGER